MGVSVYNYHIRNLIYHKSTYFSVYKTDGYDPECLYPGYMSGINPMSIIPISEWRDITQACPEPGNAQNYPISGDINGFDDATWHSKLHIICSDGENAALGVAVVCERVDLIMEPKDFRIIIYSYTSTHSGIWQPGGFPHECEGDSPDYVQSAYNKQVEWVYLCMLDVDDGRGWYPYPERFAIGFTQPATERFIVRNHGSTFIEGLHVESIAPSDVAPDPEPTPVINDDPYAPGGSTWTGGGSGNFDDTSDPIGIPDLPTLSAASTGFLTLFNPSAAQMRSLAQYMWSGLFDIDTFRKIFADPMQCILGLSIVPVNVPSGGSATVKVGNIDTGISMTTASSQFVTVSCGSLSIDEYWGSYLDYEPYTKMELYLPYCGIHPLNTDDVMGKSITVTYHVDVLSGACVAYVSIGGAVMYSYAGQCGASIPITGNDWTNVINGALSIAGSIGSMVATGGASAPMALGSIASTAVNSMKPNVEKSGSLSGTAGLMAVQTPYIIITRPKQAIPEKQNYYQGYPSFITTPLGNLSGYTEVDSVHLENIPATGDEIAEIESLLKSGVIF